MIKHEMDKQAGVDLGSEIRVELKLNYQLPMTGIARNDFQISPCHPILILL
jgi:hypothetical protein